jgi:hypothetical protein
MHYASIAIVVLVGCVPDIDGDITPVSDNHSLIWREDVARAISVIAEAVYPCETPFRIVDDGFKIRLIEKTHWTHGTNVGFFDHESVDIRATENGFPPSGGILLHELGHMLGLEHISDRRSVMNEIAAPRLMIGDAAMFAKVGCR